MTFSTLTGPTDAVRLKCSSFYKYLSLSKSRFLVPHSSLLTPHASCLIPHASCLTPHASRLFYLLRSTSVMKYLVSPRQGNFM